MADAGKIRAIAKLYEYLAEFSERDLRMASEAPSLLMGFREALHHLATARKQLDTGAKTSTDRPRIIDNTPRAVSDTFPRVRDRGTQGGNSPKKLLQRIILDKRYFPTSQDVAKFFSQHGMPIKLAPKDSRTRILARVEKAFPLLNAATQHRILADLERLAERNQTSGWFSVIRGDTR
jgi:hypothetical protein